MATASHRVPVQADQRGLGAYGLRLAGLDGARSILQVADPTWPVLTVTRTVGPANLEQQYVRDDAAAFNLQGEIGVVHLKRQPLSADMTLDKHYDDAAVVHPFLAMTSAIANRWLGREAFHAGAFEFEGNAWAVVGEKGAGKSSTLAHLASRGMSIVTDDVLILDNGEALGGPSCIDLRPDAASLLSLGQDLGIIGARHRWRHVTPPTPEPIRLAGWIFPSWSEEMAMTRVAPTDRLPLILGNLALSRTPLNAMHILDLASLPCWRWQRPRAWSKLEDAATYLLETLAGERERI